MDGGDELPYDISPSRRRPLDTRKTEEGVFGGGRCLGSFPNWREKDPGIDEETVVSSSKRVRQSQNTLQMMRISSLHSKLNLVVPYYSSSL